MSYDHNLTYFLLLVDTPKTSVFYRYHEGFSNAVRKPMTVQMFL